MIPLVDTHCHLLAGLDDGPRTLDDSLAMCRIAWQEGVRSIAATAHVNERWPGVTPDRIRDATKQLTAMLAEHELALSVHPMAEVMVWPGLEDAWQNGELLTAGDHGKHILLELPNNLFIDLRETVSFFRAEGVFPILAHPERHPEFLHDGQALEMLVERGCLIQVTSGGITNPANRAFAVTLKNWIRRGLVHLVVSDGHSPGSRAPRMRDAYRRITRWAGSSIADRLCGTNGLAILEGLPLQIPKPEPSKKGWRTPLSRLSARLSLN